MMSSQQDYERCTTGWTVMIVLCIIGIPFTYGLSIIPLVICLIGRSSSQKDAKALADARAVRRAQYVKPEIAGKKKAGSCSEYYDWTGHETPGEKQVRRTKQQDKRRAMEQPLKMPGVGTLPQIEEGRAGRGRERPRGGVRVGGRTYKH